MKIRSIIKGFTLIELLVVITIIGILATGAVTIYTAQIQKARDTTRISDIKALQSSIEQVYQDATEYPHSDEFASGAGVDVKTYMERIPSDPKTGQKCNGSTPCDYIYVVAPNSNGITFGLYELSTGFESQGNLDSKAAKDGGSDIKRFEIGLSVSTLNTTKSGSISGSGCSALSGTLDSTSVIKIAEKGC